MRTISPAGRSNPGPRDSRGWSRSSARASWTRTARLDRAEMARRALRRRRRAEAPRGRRPSGGGAPVRGGDRRPARRGRRRGLLRPAPGRTRARGRASTSSSPCRRRWRRASPGSSASGRMTEQDARARAAAQASDAEREAAADMVVRNEGDLDALGREADRVWADLARARAPGRAERTGRYPRTVTYRAVFFDAGETLVHPHPSFAELFTLVLHREGFDVDPAVVGRQHARHLRALPRGRERHVDDEPRAVARVLALGVPPAARAPGRARIRTASPTACTASSPTSRTTASSRTSRTRSRACAAAGCCWAWCRTSRRGSSSCSNPSASRRRSTSG